MVHGKRARIPQLQNKHPSVTNRRAGNNGQETANNPNNTNQDSS